MTDYAAPIADMRFVLDELAGLGEIAGLHTRIQIIAVPGHPEQAPTRKQLLDRVDGVVMVVDSQGEPLVVHHGAKRHGANDFNEFEQQSGGAIVVEG